MSRFRLMTAGAGAVPVRADKGSAWGRALKACRARAGRLAETGLCMMRNRLGKRALAPGAEKIIQDMKGKITTLAALAPGEKGRITKITARGPMKRRLMDMGVLVGETVRVEKVAPLGDPIEVSVKDYRLSFRKKEAEGVLVEMES